MSLSDSESIGIEQLWIEVDMLVKLFPMISFLLLFTAMCAIAQHVQVSHPQGMIVMIPSPIKLDMNRLVELCPTATGEVFFVLDYHKWTSADVMKSAIEVPGGPLLCTITQHIDIGSAFALTKRGSTSLLSLPEVVKDPPVTQLGLDFLKAALRDKLLPDLLVAHHYQVEVINPADGRSAKYIAIIDTSATSSAFPNLYDRIGVHAGGSMHVITHTTEVKVMVGAVKLRVLRKAYPDGLDEETGSAKYRFENLPENLRQSISDSPLVVAQMSTINVPVIGLDTLMALNVKVDPQKGLIQCEEDPPVC